MKMIRFTVMALLALGGLAACTPADEQYCQSYGVSGAEFDKCMRYYHQQEAAFGADRDVCEMEADLTYPPSLYDRGGYAHVMGSFGPHGEYYGPRTVHVDPDWYHNQQIDRLRMRIIEPCMRAKGWNSGSSWEAGRHNVKAVPKKAVTNQKLPWKK